MNYISRRELAPFLCCMGVFWSGAGPAIAQIIPDTTLGNEASRVVPGITTDRGIIDQINGGAVRNTTLFHSFSEFNIQDKQQVYFSNPSVIDDIIGRVTGENSSVLLGRLGVLGDANLFLINPNGIIFGPDATLDVAGSFVASTADQLLFNGGEIFSATDPQGPPLLSAEASIAGIDQWLPSRGTIASSGNLRAGKDLILSGKTIEGQGSLEAGQNLSVIASDSLTLSDSTSEALLVRSGQNLRLQGNQQLQIEALSNSGSGLLAGGDLLLRSDGTVVSDAIFSAGGDLRVEQLDGSLGGLLSPNDPVIRARGDVSFDSYAGASLHILAGGSVTVPGKIEIQGVETTDFLAESVVLSDGTLVEVDGSARPTLDVRAGVTPDAIGAPLSNSATGAEGVSISQTPSRADISINEVEVSAPDGLVLISNQYQPNGELNGDIQLNIINPSGSFGFISADSKDKLSITGRIGPLRDSGGAADILLLANGDIEVLNQALIITSTTDATRSGNVTLKSPQSILMKSNEPDGFPSSILAPTYGPNPGGDISIQAGSLIMEGRAQIGSAVLDEGKGGNIEVQATESVSLTGFDTFLGASVFGSGTGEGGDVDITTEKIIVDVGTIAANTFGPGQGGNMAINASQVSVLNGGVINIVTSGEGNAGNLVLNASDSVSIVGETSPEVSEFIFVSKISTQSIEGSTGNAGNLTLTTTKLSLLEGGQLDSGTFAKGQGGNLLIRASDSVELAGLRSDGLGASNIAVSSSVSPDIDIADSDIDLDLGDGGELQIDTARLIVREGAQISAGTQSNGNSGNLTINATELVQVTGTGSNSIQPEFSTDPVVKPSVSDSSIFTQADNSAFGLGGGRGNAGRLTINTKRLLVENSGGISAATFGQGNASDLTINASESVELVGEGSELFAGATEGSGGSGGSIFVAGPDEIILRNKARILVNSQGTGKAGDVSLLAERLILSDQSQISAETFSNTGGDIILSIDDLVVLQGESSISSTAGTASASGNGGNIALDTDFLVADVIDNNNDITANAFLGKGGQINVTAEGIFGFTPRSFNDLATLLGTTDPAELDPANLPTNDITAISQTDANLAGETNLNAPEVDPNRGSVLLPDNLVDPSRLVSQGCSAATVSSDLGSFTVTGRGGLPPSPGDPQVAETIMVEWDTPMVHASEQASSQSLTPTPRSSWSQPIVEVQHLAKRADGGIDLVALAPNAEPWHSDLPCPANKNARLP